MLLHTLTHRRSHRPGNWVIKRFCFNWHEKGWNSEITFDAITSLLLSGWTFLPESKINNFKVKIENEKIEKLRQDASWRRIELFFFSKTPPGPQRISDLDRRIVCCYINKANESQSEREMINRQVKFTASFSLRVISNNGMKQILLKTMLLEEKRTPVMEKMASRTWRILFDWCEEGWFVYLSNKSYKNTNELLENLNEITVREKFFFIYW